MTRRTRALALFAVLPLVIAGCGGGPEVLRVVNGRVVGGEFVEPEAYAAFLRGAIAEAAGDVPAALGSYEDAARYDGDDPEIWTRIGDVRCKSEHGRVDPSADAALERALRIDKSYAPAWDARARCALGRGDSKRAADAAARSLEADPLAVEAEVLRARMADAGGAPSSDETRRRLVALTMFHGGRVEAWEALGAWASSHGDGALYAIALQRLALLAPSKRPRIADAARAFEGAGDSASARALAGALVDAGFAGDRKGAAFALVARLAIDAALLAGDADRARLRATRAHVDLEVVAARALLIGDPSLARALAEPLFLANPGATGAKIVLAAAAPESDDAARVAALRAIAEGAVGIAGETVLVFVQLLARATSIDAARAFADRVQYAPLLAHDARTTSLAVDLAARGALDPSALPPDGAIELAARRGEMPPASLLSSRGPAESPESAPANTPANALDARHALLALALNDPRGARTSALARDLAPSADRDALVAVAFVRLALAGAAPMRADALARFDPADALVAAAAYDLAVRGGNDRAIPSARARLAAVARTPAERARVQ